MKHPVSNHGFKIRNEVGIANKEQREQKAEAKNYDIYHSENIYDERSYLAGKQVGFEIGIEQGKAEGIRVVVDGLDIDFLINSLKQSQHLIWQKQGQAICREQIKKLGKLKEWGL